MRQGLTKADDTLPKRLMEEPIKAGESKGHKISREELTQMLTEYYTEAWLGFRDRQTDPRQA